MPPQNLKTCCDVTKNPEFRASKKLKKHSLNEAGTGWVIPCHLELENMF
jgi:hypothetical protein